MVIRLWVRVVWGEDCGGTAALSSGAEADGANAANLNFHISENKTFSIFTSLSLRCLNYFVQFSTKLCSKITARRLIFFIFFVYWFDYALLLLYFLLMENSIIKCEFTFFFSFLKLNSMLESDLIRCCYVLCVFVYLSKSGPDSVLSLSLSLSSTRCLFTLSVLFVYSFIAVSG